MYTNVLHFIVHNVCPSPMKRKATIAEQQHRCSHQMPRYILSHLKSEHRVELFSHKRKYKVKQNKKLATVNCTDVLTRCQYSATLNTHILPRAQFVKSCRMPEPDDGKLFSTFAFELPPLNHPFHFHPLMELTAKLPLIKM